MQSTNYFARVLETKTTQTMSDKQSPVPHCVCAISNGTARSIFYTVCFTVAYAGMRARGLWEMEFPRLFCLWAGWPLSLVAYVLVNERSNNICGLDVTPASSS